jgi:acetolactate synthase-1/2/3 large subunit
MKIMQKKNFKRLVGSSKESGISFPNFEKIAKTFNIKYFKLQKNLIENQIKKIINLSTPALIEVNMPPEQPLIPRTQNKLLADGTFYTPRLDDLYPHLSNSNLENERLKAIKIK